MAQPLGTGHLPIGGDVAAVRDEALPWVLLVGLEQSPAELAAGASLRHASGPRAAMQMLRILSFDLVVLPLHLEQQPVWELVRRIRLARPRQPWVLLHDLLDDEDERTARMLGVLAIMSSHRRWAPLLQSLHPSAAVIDRSANHS